MAYICTTPNGIALQAQITSVTTQLAYQQTNHPSNGGLISSLQQLLNTLQMELVDYCMINELAVMSASNILVVM